MDLYSESKKATEELTDKHWEECRQISIYDDQLKKAMKLLDKVSDIHYAAIRGSVNEASLLSGKLMHEIRSLENEIIVSERRHSNG